MPRSASRYWIGVASKDHVQRGAAGGFCQLGHGKAAPVRRLKPGDWIVYYSPRTALDGGEPVQSFTAIGEVAAGDAYEADAGGGFFPTRRDVRFRKGVHDAPIRPLLDRLEMTRGKASWGMALRRSAIEISRADFEVIARAMGLEPPALRTE